MGKPSFNEIKNKNVRSLMYTKLKKEKSKVNLKNSNQIIFNQNF